MIFVVVSFMCLIVYSIVYSKFVAICSILLYTVGGILQIFSAFLADISTFSPPVAADFPVFFVSLFDIFSFPLVSIYFWFFLQCFSTRPFFILYFYFRVNT